MTFPRKYSAACTDLIGAVIDHNPGYRNPEGEGSSKLVGKLDAVYATERLFVKDYSHDLGWMISNRTIQDFCFELEQPTRRRSSTLDAAEHMGTFRRQCRM